MIPRGQLDIGGWDLARACGLVAAETPTTDHQIRQAIAGPFPADGRATVAALSVRSAWDALLATSGWRVGTEILCSAVNIPEMPALVAHHGFVPVPLEVDRRTLTVDPGEIRRRSTPRTRAVVVAALFGSRPDLEPLQAVAAERNLVVVEDLAQGYAADGFGGDPAADVSLFSFGLIKSNTALGGAVARTRDTAWAGRAARLMATWPVRTTDHFRRRGAKGLALHLIAWPPLYTAVRAAVEAAGADWDAELTRLTRGFSGETWPQRLRYQPGGAELAFLADRLNHPNAGWFERRREIGERYRERLPETVRPGDAAPFPSRWVCPVVARDPQTLMQALIAAGYDATRRASQLTVLEPPPAYATARPVLAADWLPRLVYLPLHPALTDRDIDRIADIVHQHAG